MPDLLSAAELQARLDTRWMGRALEIHEEIGSTNTRAVTLARAGAAGGTAVLAEYQTEGRGRLGRRWHSPAGSALLMSIILRPHVAPQQAHRVMMVCSMAAIDAIEQTCGLCAQVKWPNDIVIGGKKLGGMLAEMGLRDGVLDYVVVGLGLNVNLDPAAVPEAMTPPTSLQAELGHTVSRLDLLVALLRAMEDLCDRMAGGWSPHELWRRSLVTLGQRVQAGTPEEVIEGWAEDVDADGALLLRVADGSLRRLLVGDVTLRDQSARREG
jgi:BirA family biotin operon repressor/biotin-[acetyl-CoA-carboxylase] ligase